MKALSIALLALALGLALPAAAESPLAAEHTVESTARPAIDTIEAVDGQRGDAGVDRPVEAGPVDPDHGRSESLRPVGDLVVVAHHRHGQWRCGGDHRLGHPAGEVGPLARIEDRRQACLGAAEGLERDQYGRLHPERRWGGHPPESVGALGSLA